MRHPVAAVVVVVVAATYLLIIYYWLLEPVISVMVLLRLTNHFVLDWLYCSSRLVVVDGDVNVVEAVTLIDDRKVVEYFRLI